MLMTRHFDCCPSASEGDNQSVGSSAPEVSRCFPGGYNVKLYISRGRLAWWLLAFLHSGCSQDRPREAVIVPRSIVLLIGQKGVHVQLGMVSVMVKILGEFMVNVLKRTLNWQPNSHVNSLL